MKLLKSSNAQRGKGITKFSLNCDHEKDKWLNLINILYKSYNQNVIIIKALYENKKNIVLKVGMLEAINKEFDNADKLKDLPSFIRYYCKFICNDDIKDIIKNEDMITTYKLCEQNKDKIGIISMNYYEIGSIGNYNWGSENFNILKNVLCQTIFAILYSYQELGFLHGDLHCDNILLKNKNINEINYGDYKLPIDMYEVRIMDFEKSRFDKNIEFKFILDNIQKLFDSIRNNSNYQIQIDYNTEMLRKMKNNVIIDNIRSYNISKLHYEKLKNIIDTFYIEYQKY